ncbi:hypothetical protein FACS1894164_20300 [Spirochaetia bacterium]|nr:hypothetical protein FACS1894164_20300 [Spirochaetia bacterium]
MNMLAEELNEVLRETVAGRLLSGLGQRLYFPKGIIAQSAEARKNAHFANATIGMAYQNGRPIIMSAVADEIPSLTPEEIVVYAPTAGVERTRLIWKDILAQKNPSIDPQGISLPVVVPGITAGISYIADLFIDEATPVLSSRPCWDNYELIFGERRGAPVTEIPFFGSGPGLDLDGIRQNFRSEARSGQVRAILNFPNNPSGYSPTHAEADTLIEIVEEIAESGADVLVICDDAYFGLFYDADFIQESLFGRLSTIHERVLAVKIDGPTKEDYAWGFRMGFVTFGSKNLQSVHYDALVKKLMGAIRSSVSCANTPAQTLMLKTMDDPRTPAEKERYYNLLKSRYHAVKHFIESRPPLDCLQALPFNSGYFMTFRCVDIDAEKLRLELLHKHGIGVVAFGTEFLRIAFSSIDESQIESVYRIVYDTARSMGNS